MLDENGLVLVWVTNKQKYLEFVRDQLFVEWGVQLVGHWHWAKVFLSLMNFCFFM